MWAQIPCNKTQSKGTKSFLYILWKHIRALQYLEPLSSWSFLINFLLLTKKVFPSLQPLRLASSWIGGEYAFQLHFSSKFLTNHFIYDTECNQIINFHIVEASKHKICRKKPRDIRSQHNLIKCRNINSLCKDERN